MMTFMPIINVWKLPTITVSLKHNLKKNHCLGWRNEHQLTLKGGRPHVKKTPEETSHSRISLINRRSSTEVHREEQRGDNLKVSVKS